MSHEITETDGAIFHKKPAWHGLGVVVEDALTTDDALVKGGLDWTVSKSGGITADGVESKDFCAIIRDDTKTILSVQSPDYEILQNRDHFALGKDFGVESALSLQGGKKVVLLLKGDTFAPSNSPSDATVQYLALINSHDGTMALSALPTSVRIVCANTLRMALNGRGKGMFKVTHNGDMNNKVRDMEDAIHRFRETGNLFKETVDRLSKREMSVSDVQSFWVKVYERLFGEIPTNPITDTDKSAVDKAADEISRWAATFDAERLALNAPASAWMAANAVTKNIQHRVGKRGRKMTPESRAYQNLMGDKQDDTVLVMTEALALV